MIEIALDRNEIGPGDVLEGVVHGLEGMVTLQVVWETRGKGDTDRAVVDERSISNEDPTFRVQLPLLPLSYDGFLIKIGWWVVVIGPEGTVSCPFTVRIAE